MNENKLTPSIRFKNNDGENYPEWDFVKVKEIASINTGNKDTKDAVENGQYDFYVRSPIVHKIDSFSYDGEAVLTVGDGVGVGKVFHYVNGKFDFHQRVYKISDFKDYYGLLFYYYFQKNFLKEAQKYNAKTSVDSVRKSMIADMYVPKIEMSEQIKIGNFFSKLDRQIELEEQKLAKLEEQKKGYMQQIFSQKICFKDDNGNDYPKWESKKFLDIFKLAPSKNNQIKSSEVVENGIIPVVDQGKDIFLGYSNEKDKAIEDFNNVIVYGDHTTIIKYIKEPFIIGGDGVKLLESNDGSLIHYLYILLQYFNVKPEGYKRHYSILKNKMMNISNTKEEQEKIGNFFAKFDELIEKQSSKIGVLKQRKKGFLQKMFV
ncbi:restriction endonuclease subunit S [Staphylococcus saprophyticus]|nr:restriction endonuclease subunit S [Staphylococcus saprophyticus]MDW4033822.1 restriction endonuclease subunit S [Staphylococcus saprophyticus]MDW4103124.1 restriction endonuclease subunit S [Staphylococcus saprophyticus]MDW4488717.1 restriction endonuclease subunit S [Staphylococcus saprophyticus]